MKKTLLLFLLFIAISSNAQTQVEYQALVERLDALEAKLAEAKIDDKTETKKSRLTLGGYGEITYSRHYYSDSFKRYASPLDYADDPSYGRMDIPHAVFFVGYDLGKGWSFGSEIEFEHGGLEVAVELETEENGEYETEVENGGEVILEQFWINKRWSKALNLKMGHIIVPVGQTNKYHMPNEYFGVFRPEGESTILPCAWHESGVSLWGSVGKWDYEVMVVAGLDAERFNSTAWVAGASGSPYEFTISNSYAAAFRVDNHSVKNLTIGVSGYYLNNSVGNTLKDISGLDDVTGTVGIISADFDYRPKNFVARGNFTYGTLSDAETVSLRVTNQSGYSISSGQNVGEAAISYGGEVGYDIFSLIKPMRERNQKLFIFGRYEYYDSMMDSVADYYASTCISGGINYSPIPQITFKAEYQTRRFCAPFNTENTLSFGVTYVAAYK